jgi:hypothetical protein
MAWDTALNILNDSAKGLGLISAALTDPFANTNPNIVQLCQLLNDLGQDLLRDYSWSHLRKEYTFSTANGTASYALPTDLARVVDQTAWNRTQQMPMRGPVNGQQWQQLQAGLVSFTLPGAFRIFGDLFYIYSTPTAIETIAYEYQSRYWVKPTGQSSPTSESTTAYQDTLYFDRRVLVTGLKLYFRRAKGFDSTAAQDEFTRAVERAMENDSAAPVLSLNGGTGGMRLLDGLNVPETGFGS